MMHILVFVASILLYAGFTVLSRYTGIQSSILDWMMLSVCAVLPLSDAKVRSQKPGLIVSLLLANAIFLFATAFLVIAAFFREGL